MASAQSPSIQDFEHSCLPIPPRPNSLTRQTTVLLQSGEIVKAKVSFPSQDHMDSHTLHEMMARWRKRAAFIETTLSTQHLSHDDIFILQTEWTNLVRRMNATQTLLDLLQPMEV